VGFGVWVWGVGCWDLGFGVWCLGWGLGVGCGVESAVGLLSWMEPLPTKAGFRKPNQPEATHAHCLNAQRLSPCEVVQLQRHVRVEEGLVSLTTTPVVMGWTGGWMVGWIRLVINGKFRRLGATCSKARVCLMRSCQPLGVIGSPHRLLSSSPAPHPPAQPPSHPPPIQPPYDSPEHVVLPPQQLSHVHSLLHLGGRVRKHGGVGAWRFGCLGV